MSSIYTGVVFAADYEILNIESINANKVVDYSTNPSNNIIDGDEATYTLFDISGENPKIEISLGKSIVTKIRLATKNFVAWKNVKTISATLDSGDTQKATVPECSCDTVWVEFDISGHNVEKITFEILDFYDNSKSNYCAVNEIEVTGVAANVAEGSERSFKYETDFTIVNSSGIASDGNWARWFDGNYDTTNNLGPLANGYFVIQFAYPTDVSKIVFTPTVNNNWTAPTAVSFEVYNEETKYRKRMVNPSPVEHGTVYPIALANEAQPIDLNNEPLMRKITHLVVNIPQWHTYIEGNSWGGFREVEIFGTMHTESQKVADMINYEQVSCVQLFRDMGVIPQMAEGQTKEDYMATKVTRLDAMKYLLKFNGEYETAMKYNGAFNYDDASEVPDYKNMLSYVYAHQGKYPFYQSGSFQPDIELTTKEWYILLLGQLGYVYGNDFTDATLQDMAFSLGIGDSLYSDELNLKELSISLYEILGLTYKGTEDVVIEKMKEKGVASEKDIFRFYTKYDTETKASNGEYDPNNPNNSKWYKVDKDGTFTFSRQEHPKVIDKNMFIFNSAYHLELITRGVKPKDDPDSLREELSEGLKQSGIKGLRFPGGTPAHYYFIEGYDYDAQLWHMQDKYGMASKSGNFTPIEGNENNFHADFWHWLDFCKENDLNTYFQINLYWYVDENGKVTATIPGRWTHKNGKAMLYDGTKRIKEGAAAFAKHLDKIKELGYEIDVWEMGNEDFHWINYSTLGNEYNTEDMEDNYFDLVAAYTKEIIARWPDAVICYTHLNTADDEVQEYEERGVWQYLAGSTHHYPFGSWNAPPAAEKTDIKRFVYTNDMNMVKWASANATPYEGYTNGDYVPANAVAKPGLETMITETILYRHEAWDCYAVQDKFGHALNTIKNMGEGLFDTPWKVFVVHELESSYFGWIKYDKAFNPQTRRTRTFGTYGEPVGELLDDLPEAYDFSGKVFTSSSAKALTMLADHIGGEVLADVRSSYGRHIAGYASENSDHTEITFTLVNRMEEEGNVEIKLPEWTVDAQSIDMEIMQSDYLWAVLDEEYNHYNKAIEIKGNADDKNSNVIEFTIEPYSIVHFKVKVK